MSQKVLRLNCFVLHLFTPQALFMICAFRGICVKCDALNTNEAETAHLFISLPQLTKD